MANQSEKSRSAEGRVVGKREDGEQVTHDDELSVYEAVVEIVKRDAHNTPKDEDAMLRKLQSWWSTYYQRPLKDPLLQTYTLEELLYEYHDKIERDKADKVRAEQKADKIDEERLQQNLDWAEQEELRELEEQRKKSEEDDTVSITKDDEKWMEEQLRKDKEKFGEDFGEDLDLNFEE